MELILQYIKIYFSQKGQGISEYALLLGFVVTIASVVLLSPFGGGKMFMSILEAFGMVIRTLTGKA